MRLPPVKKGYAKHLARLVADKILHDVEHYRQQRNGDSLSPEEEKIGAKYPGRQWFDHYAVVVLTDGWAYVGMARCSFKDQYCRSIGHEISVGRALDKARRYDVSGCCFKVPFAIPTGSVFSPMMMPIGGVELRDYCRRRLVEQGYMDELPEMSQQPNAS